MPVVISVMYHTLLDHYGPLLIMKRLAEVLHTTDGGFRMAIVLGTPPRAVRLAGAQR